VAYDRRALFRCIVEHWSAGPFPGRIDPWAEAGHYFKPIHGGVISELLEDYGVQVSMSNKGDPYDNAMMESFFSTLRAELTDLKHFAARQAVRTAVFEFIESILQLAALTFVVGYRSPLTFENAHSSSTKTDQDLSLRRWTTLSCSTSSLNFEAIPLG
jgi:hypothetical protein